MCGIAGIYGVGDADLTRKMLGLLAHRGPDGIGVRPVGEVAVGNVRLAILDVPRGHQPMVSRDGSCWIAHNGEVYNHAALREELGGDFRTHTDTEVLLRLHEEAGAEMVQRLDGMFAFAITDGDDLVLARDPLGIKPLYYGYHGDALLFASEVKALVGRVDEIQEFPAGHWYHSRSGFHRYFQLRANGAGMLECEHALVSLREALDAAVCKRLMADVPVGVCLSGGLDSSLIAALAARVHDGPFHTFAVGTQDSTDVRRARRVAKDISSLHHERIYTLGDMLAVLPRVIYYLESYDVALVRSAIPNYFVADLARPYVKVVLGGEGADELFSGYAYLKHLPADQPLTEELLEITEALHNTNLQRVDRMTMAHGLEGRVPFLDVRMLRVAFRIPESLKLYGDEQVEKWILRQAFDDLLPDDILWREKEKFSEGAGSAKLLAAYADDQFTDREFQCARDQYPEAGLRSKEEFLYFRLFRSFYPTLDLHTIGRSRRV